LLDCELVQQIEASHELTVEVGGWLLEVSPAQKVEAEGSTG
jgi:hypothetical protein